MTVGLPVFVINLEHRTDRRESATAQLASIGVEPVFIKAVDGRSLTAAQLARYDEAARLRIAGKPMQPAEIACYLSHLSIFETVVREDLPQAVIMEDDLMVTEDLPRVLEALGDMRHPPYDLLKLSIGRLERKRAFLKLSKLTEQSFIVRHPKACNSLTGYVVTRAGAEKFLRWGSTIRYPIDVAVNRTWENGLELLAVRPWPVHHDWDSPSSIGDARFAPAPRRHGVVGALERLSRRIGKARDSVVKRVTYLATLRRDIYARRTENAGGSTSRR